MMALSTNIHNILFYSIFFCFRHIYVAESKMRICQTVSLGTQRSSKSYSLVYMNRILVYSKHKQPKDLNDAHLQKNIVRAIEFHMSIIWKIVGNCRKRRRKYRIFLVDSLASFTFLCYSLKFSPFYTQNGNFSHRALKLTSTLRMRIWVGYLCV